MFARMSVKGGTHFDLNENGKQKIRQDKLKFDIRINRLAAEMKLLLRQMEHEWEWFQWFWQNEQPAGVWYCIDYKRKPVCIGVNRQAITKIRMELDTMRDESVSNRSYACIQYSSGSGPLIVTHISAMYSFTHIICMH